MGRIGAKITELWQGSVREEKLAVVLAAVAIVVLGGLAATDLIRRPPADVSNPDVAFEARVKPKAEKVTEASDWPRYGLDRARTKYMNAPKVSPPYKKIWSYDRDELIEFAPIIVDGTMYGIDNDAVVFALDTENGKELWRRDIGSLNASSPAYSNHRLIAVNLSPPQVVAMRATDGKTVWQKPLPSRAESSPLYHNGRIYFGTESGDFFAMRTSDGKTLWHTKLAGSVKAAPAYLGGSLYVGDYAGDFYAIRASDGRIRWQAGGDGRFYSTPAVAFGRVYVGNVDGRLYSFDRKTGDLAWTHSAGDFVYSGVAAADTKRTPPTIYFGSHDRYLYALDARSGDTRWRQEPGGQISGPATVIGTIVYVSTFSGNATVGFNIKTGQKVFRIGIGEYGPVVSDGVRLFIVGGDEIRAYDPIKNAPGYKKWAPGTRGIVSPKAFRGGKSGKGGGKSAPAQAKSKRRKGSDGGEGKGSAKRGAQKDSKRHD